MCWSILRGLLYWSQCNRHKLVQTELVTELDPLVALHRAAVSGHIQNREEAGLQTQYTCTQRNV